MPRARSSVRFLEATASSTASVFAGASIEKGYSGAGVYDPEQDAIVGMIAEVDKDPDRRAANFIDAASLCEALGIPTTTLAWRPQSTLLGQLRTISWGAPSRSVRSRIG